MKRPLSRTQTTANVRKALIRHWIDLDRLVISPSRGTVRVSGELRSIRREVGQRGMAALLQILEDDIRRCHGVSRVLFDLTNWMKNSAGEWVCLDKDMPKDSGSQPSQSVSSSAGARLIFHTKSKKKKDSGEEGDGPSEEG